MVQGHQRGRAHAFRPFLLFLFIEMPRRGPTASLSTASLSGLGFERNRRILSIFITLSLLNTHTAGGA
jgi:hypothetical protein